MLYLVSQNESSQTPLPDELNLYALENNLTYPLLVDTDTMVGSRFSTDNYIPSLSLFDRGAVVMVTDGEVTEQDIIDLL